MSLSFEDALETGNLDSVKKCLQAESAGILLSKKALGLSKTLFRLICRIEDELAMVQIANLLLEYGADLHEVNHIGESALHEAARIGSAALVELLLKYQADPLIQDNNGHSAYYIAAWLRQSDVLKVFERYGHNELIPDDEIETCEACAGLLSESEWTEQQESYVCKCGTKVSFPLHYIDPERGIMVSCPLKSCRATATIPPSVWCSFCGQNLERDWRRRIKL